MTLIIPAKGWSPFTCFFQAGWSISENLQSSFGGFCLPAFRIAICRQAWGDPSRLRSLSARACARMATAISCTLHSDAAARNLKGTMQRNLGLFVLFGHPLLVSKENHEVWGSPLFRDKSMFLGSSFPESPILSSSWSSRCLLQAFELKFVEHLYGSGFCLFLLVPIMFGFKEKLAGISVFWWVP